ncbi:phage antirepressor [Lactobacillus mulieris]|uniref:Phage antirepressor n=1 Tax=Lactobacillus jensenii TaxID=109790 RepID=A0ABU9FL18_LACJE|nr:MULTISPECIES: phage antirepressor [Lactobacillus]DAK37249.1 MAG TPA: repressor domain protein [Caudoviricetes sp.]MCW8105918.1 phage antirepressor [Lactobacillus mulieris]MDK7295055.1 phage antirepressor [Lactobacillus jensenii]MDK7349376.1 phage antirepressor [Lactobacillus mulieris]MDT9545416.1 phage antirepressor [Lactobacillus jensenii]
MKDLQIFSFNGLDVRTVLIDGEPYFVGKDIAEILGYAKSRNAIKNHVDDEDKKDAPIQGDLGGTQTMTVINESGLYSLILSSKLPTAKKFKHWVTSEVLPAIRKHGGYLTDEKIEEVLYNPDTLIKLATQLKDEREGRLIAEQQVAELKPKASYYDTILNNKDLVPVSYIAKDYGYSAKGFNLLLKELKIQYKLAGTWLLKSKYQSYGWTSTASYPIETTHGHKTSTIMKWTQKGRLGLYNELKKHGILPMIEREDVVNG